MNARQLEKLGVLPGSMAEQSDMVDMVARFDPKIVKMCGDGSKAEDLCRAEISAAFCPQVVNLS